MATSSGSGGGRRLLSACEAAMSFVVLRSRRAMVKCFLQVWRTSSYNGRTWNTTALDAELPYDREPPTGVAADLRPPPYPAGADHGGRDARARLGRGGRGLRHRRRLRRSPQLRHGHPAP